MSLDYVRIEPSEIQETGEYDLEGLFIRLQHAIDSVGAKRVVLDTLEAVFSGFSNQGMLRAEIRRLFRWLKDRGLTTVVTAERGDGTLTRYGLEEYVSDCVVALDHRVNDQISTRRMRIVKYRGSAHGTDEYPFLNRSQGLFGAAAVGHSAESQGFAGPCFFRREVIWMQCWKARDSTKGRLCWCPGLPVPANPRWPRTLPMKRAAPASAPCTSRSKNQLRRSRATCSRWGSIWGSTSTRDCCNFAPGAPRNMV